MVVRNNDEDTLLTQAFQEETRERIARDTRRGVLATLFMYPIFIPLDYLVYPDTALTFVWIRLAVVGLSIAVHLLMRLPFAQRHARWFGIFAYLYCTLAIVLMVHLVEGYASPYYAGINLVLIAFLFILPMNVGETAIVSGIVYLAYIVPILIAGGIRDIAVLMANNFFMVSTMLLVVLSSYLATVMRRREFTSRFELANANEELKELDVVKSQFFASISHEIRTPLTSIMAPTESLYRGDVGRLTEAQHSLVEQVHRNTLRLLDLINQMLDFAKFDAQKMKLHLRRVDMAELVRDQVALFQEVCSRKGITLEYRISGQIPVIFLDLEKVERIVSNLIRNAVKFTDKGLISLTVSVADQPLTESNREPGMMSGTGRLTRWLLVEVRDTGIGIAEEDADRIFQRFHQVDGSTTRRYEGTGLGLAIVRESVELQHGRISLDSSLGEGSVFTVELPTNLEDIEPTADIDRREVERRREDKEFHGPERRSGPRRGGDHDRISMNKVALLESGPVPDEEVIPVEIPQTKPSTGIQVIYVEDNADLRRYVGRMLRSFGHTVDTAVDGIEGWEMTRGLLPDIVVSDVMMPGMDGFELARRVKTTDATRKIPIVLITAKSETDARIEGLELGADDYLAKPINMRELDARINNIVSERRFRDAFTRAEELEKRVAQLTYGFSRSLELRDGYTAGHSDDVLQYGTVITEELELVMSQTLRDSLLLHDIGKLGIPDDLLKKPAPLTKEEWTVMRRHPEMGAELLKQFESLSEMSQIVAAHHERFDGTGYPRGLSGDEIPIESRIIAVADSWHAMREDRTYRSAIPVDQAVGELIRNRGKQFDPVIVDCFLTGMVRRRLIPAKLVEQHKRQLSD